MNLADYHYLIRAPSPIVTSPTPRKNMIPNIVRTISLRAGNGLTLSISPKPVRARSIRFNV